MAGKKQEPGGQGPKRRRQKPPPDKLVDRRALGGVMQQLVAGLQGLMAFVSLPDEALQLLPEPALGALPRPFPERHPGNRYATAKPNSARPATA